jgi:hypothetical protein
VLALAAWLGVAGLPLAGHEVSYYPAFYPSQITLAVLDPEAAGKALAANKLHVYLGSAPRFAGPVPPALRSATTLGGYAVLTLDPTRPGLQDAKARCAVAADVLAAVAGGAGDAFVFHPYPVTPFHEDYIAHADRARRAIDLARARTAAGAGRAIQAEGALAGPLEKAGWKPGKEPAAAGIALREVPQTEALGGEAIGAWAPAPWIKEGWYEAWRLLSPGQDPKTLADATALAQKLMRGDVKGHVELFNLERRLVDTLSRPCTRVVAGYTLRREYTNDEYTFGIENITPDSARGLNNPVFVRTVKLKDYPWNGPLFAAAAAPAKAAWNPVAGFGD